MKHAKAVQIFKKGKQKELLNYRLYICIATIIENVRKNTISDANNFITTSLDTCVT